jgi:glycosyltransferase involved in cell wall biosynthesis
MQTDIRYSIVIPHKNIPDLLRRCLDSIPRRDDLQIIVVDDNSDTGMVDFSQFPGLGDPSVEVLFEKEGKGGGYARNIGLTRAKGAYVLFADADDFYTPDFNAILDTYKEDTSDIVFFNAHSVSSDTFKPAERSGPLNRYIGIYHTSHRQSRKKKAELLLRYRFSEPWAKIIKKSFIDEHHLRFDETPINNDCTFSYSAGFYAQAIAVESRTGYCVTTRPESLSYAPKTAEKILARIYVFGKCALFFKQHCIPFVIDNFRGDLFRLFFSDHTNYEQGKKILLELGYSQSAITLGLFKGFLRTVLFFIVPNRILKALRGRRLVLGY